MIEAWKVWVGICAGLATVISTTAYFVIACKNLKKGLNDIQEGVKCMLRSSILSVYYKHNEDDKITQYEFQNVELQYKAYKTLGGNSFIDKIWKDIQDWDVEK